MLGPLTLRMGAARAICTRSATPRATLVARNYVLRGWRGNIPHMRNSAYAEKFPQYYAARSVNNETWYIHVHELFVNNS